jgi:hypothetical protein
MEMRTNHEASDYINCFSLEMSSIIGLNTICNTLFSNIVDQIAPRVLADVSE